MTVDRRPGDLMESIGNGLVIYYTFPLIVGLISILGMLVGVVLGIPFYLIYWVGPEQFMVEHFGLSLILWGIGMGIAIKVMFFQGVRMFSPEIWSNVLGGLLFLVAGFIVVFVIAGGLAFLAYLDVDWAQRALERS